MAKIQFSQDLIRYLPVYLGTSLGEIAKAGFKYSKPLLYKVADGSIPVSYAVNNAFNRFWEERKLTLDDLNNIYALIDLIKTGTWKEKEYQLKVYKQSKSNNEGGN